MVKIKNIELKKLDSVTKILLVLLVGLIFYFAIFSILKPFFISEPTPMRGVMGQMMGSNMMNFSTGSSTTMNLVSLIVAIGVTFIVSFYLFKSNVKDDEFRIIRKALSEDEKAILDEIKKAGEITQDSLKFRLNWSKAKISTILTNLDKINLIQRERQGKTYKVFLSKK